LALRLKAMAFLLPTGFRFSHLRIEIISMNKALITTLLLVLIVAANLHAQNYPNYPNQQDYPNQIPSDENNSQALYQRKIKTYTRVRNWGIGLLLVGGASTIIGAVYVNKGSGDAATPTPVSPGSPQPIATHDNDNNFNTGMLCLTAGIPTLIAGIVLTSIGVPKVYYYKKKLGGLSIGLAPRGAGLSFTYRF